MECALLSAIYDQMVGWIILHRMQDKRDVDVSFRHMFCIHRMALQTMHHANDAVRNVLYWFYF